MTTLGFSHNRVGINDVCQCVCVILALHFPCGPPQPSLEGRGQGSITHLEQIRWKSDLSIATVASNQVECIHNKEHHDVIFLLFPVHTCLLMRH